MTFIPFASMPRQKKLICTAPQTVTHSYDILRTQQQTFRATGDPIISVDTKKKELIGNFKNAGQAWCQEADAVNVHDFLSDALGRGIPYGIFDVQRNAGAIYVGTSADTPEFAVEAIARWWHEHGQAGYPAATRLLILADAGGSNGCRPPLWKAQVQSDLSDALRLSVTGVSCIRRAAPSGIPSSIALFSQISIKLGWQALAHLGDDAGVDPRHDHPNWAHGLGTLA